MRDDIYGGLRNALERGSSIEQAIESFVSAGYNRKEVMETANQITGNSPESVILEQPTQSQTQPQLQTQVQPQKIVSPTAQIPKRPDNQQFLPLTTKQGQKLVKYTSKGKITLLIVTLLVLVVGLIGTIFYRQIITDFLTGLF